MWGKRARISRNWATVMVGLGTVLVLVGVSLSLLMCNKKRRVCSEAQGLVEYDLCAILGLLTLRFQKRRRMDIVNCVSKSLDK